MKPSISRKLESLVERHQEISHALSAPEATQNSQRFAELSKEYAELKTIVDAFVEYQATETQLESARSMAQNEPELRELAEEEIRTLVARLPILEQTLQLLLLPSDPNDQRNIFLEIRAGTGGDEAAIFAGDLFRMYSRYADAQGWQVEVVSASHGEHGGYKEIISRIVGVGAYSKLKYESGTHRVQRVPATESQGRVHTSTCTVAILPEVDAIDDIKINPQDLKIDTFRASGAGGQHINKTDSAIRITHLPSGMIVECQDERSQHKNRARALALLSARLLDQEQQKQQQEQAHTRRMQVGTGDRSERIRTYNYSQARMTDHRINLTLYKLNEILEGDLEQVIMPLVHEHQAMQLAEMTRDGYD